MLHEVYRDWDSAKVGLFNGLLQEAGIRTMLRNWSGSNITEIPIPEFYPNICAFNEADAAHARQIISDYLHADTTGLKNWICPNCGEEIDGGFSVCWSCQTPVEEAEGSL